MHQDSGAPLRYSNRVALSEATQQIKVAAVHEAPVAIVRLLGKEPWEKEAVVSYVSVDVGENVPPAILCPLA